MKTWASHTSGAATLVALRGPEILNSAATYHLFLEARGLSVRLILPRSQIMY